MVLRRTGRVFSPDEFLPLPRRSRSFRRWAVFLAMLGIFGYMLGVAIARMAWSDGGRDESSERVLYGLLAAVGFAVLYYAACTLMMRVVQWLSVPASASRERQWQALVRGDYLSAPLVLFLTMLLTPLGFLMGEEAYRPALIVAGVQFFVILLYWLIVVLAGLKNLTGRSGRAMVWAGVKLVVAWLLILAAVMAMPLSVLMWVLLIGLL